MNVRHFRFICYLAEDSSALSGPTNYSQVWVGREKCGCLNSGGSLAISVILRSLAPKDHTHVLSAYPYMLIITQQAS